MLQNSDTQSDEIKSSILEILIQHELESVSDITYGKGSEIGDGFNSRTFTVNASDGNKSLHLFCKVPLEQASQREYIFNEILFYNSIYPAYQLFSKEKGVEDGFRNVPNCYGIRGELIALENLQRRGYNIFRRGNVMNEDHIIQTFKTFAKFHAISFAMKDQKKSLYNNFVRNICGFGEIMTRLGFDKMLTFGLQEFINSLDPIEDKVLLNGSGDLVEKLVDVVLNIEKRSNDYSIITQGDCWCNNIMYSYNQEDQETPVDIMLVDWQMIRNGSPALDLSLFFYPISSETTIRNIDLYLKIYHDELSARIKQLGSNPEILYPYAVLKDEWKKFAKYGFAMSMVTIRALVLDREGIPDGTNDTEIDQVLLTNPKNDNRYVDRMKMIFKHFIDCNLL